MRLSARPRFLDSGGTVQQETRLYNPGEGRTYTMRSKEKAHDYRYFPSLTAPLDRRSGPCRTPFATLPELPEARRQRLIAEYALSEGGRRHAHRDPRPRRHFETEAKKAKSPKRLANLVISELQGRLKAAGIELEDSPITIAGARLSADLLEDGTFSSKTLKELYDHALRAEGRFPVIYEKEKPQRIPTPTEI